jgi:hypothetical protein
VFVIAQVAGHLLGQRPFQHRLGHLGQQAVRAQQLGPLLLGPAQQLIGELLIDQGPPARRITTSGFAGHHRSV